MAGSDPEKLMLKADKLTKLSLTRWSADWRSATLLYEQAAVGFRLAKDNEKAKTAFEKASKGQEMLSSPWDAAKHMESAAAAAKELGNWSEVADFYTRACELYTECGRSQPASDALAKGARALEDATPDEAVRMYTDACGMLEEDGKQQMAFDLYRAGTSVYLKLERYTDAATFLLRWGLAADQCKAINSQCKAYLSAIIVYLYAHDFKQAEKCYNDCSQIEAFLSSDQNRCASKLLSAYAEGDIEEIKRIAQSSAISNLDHMDYQRSSARQGPPAALSVAQDIAPSAPPTTGDMDFFSPSDLERLRRMMAQLNGKASTSTSPMPRQIIRLARKLPTGDVNTLKTEATKEEEEPLDENDLT